MAVRGVADGRDTMPEKTVTEKIKNTEPKPTNGQQPSANASTNKEAKKELQKQQRIFQQLEEKIALLNKQKSEFEILLTDPSVYSNKNKFLETEKGHAKIQHELSSLNKQYEEVFEKIMQLENED